MNKPPLALLAAGLLASAPALAGEEPDIAPQVRIDAEPTNRPANETTVASSDATPDVVVAGWNDYRNAIRSVFALSTDGGQTWTEITLRPPAGFGSDVEGDPMTAFDDRDGTLWIGAISFGFNGGIYVARKDPGSAAFGPSVMARVTGGADKGWMAAGPDPSDPTNPDLTKLYIAYNQGLLVSDDRGDTWSPPTSLGSGIGFLPRVGPNGELYILYWDFDDGIWLRRSYDGGQTLLPPKLVATRLDVWGIDGSRFPGNFRVPPLAYLDVDPVSGDLYVVYFDTTQVVGPNSLVDLWFTRSTDQGETWTTPTPILQSPLNQGDAFFPWLEVDANGRINMVYYDTRRTNQNDTASQAFIDAKYAWSDTQGQTWSSVFLTDQQFNSEQTGGSAFIGDYLGLGLGRNIAYPVYLSNQNGNSDIFAHRVVNPPIAGGCTGDLDGDNDVDFDDLGILLGAFGQGDAGDADGDGDTDFDDLGLLLGAFGGGC